MTDASRTSRGDDTAQQLERADHQDTFPPRAAPSARRAIVLVSLETPNGLTLRIDKISVGLAKRFPPRVIRARMSIHRKRPALCLSDSEAASILSYIAGFRLYHHDDGATIDAVNAGLEAIGRLPLDNGVYDIAQEAATLNAHFSLSIPDFSLRTLAMRSSVPATLLERSDAGDIDARAEVVRSVLTKLTLPGVERMRQSTAPHAPHDPESWFLRLDQDGRGVAEADMRVSRQDPGMPDPEDAAMTWRRTAWTSDEALEAALLYRQGAGFHALSQMTRRSPAAIYARLALDGVIDSDVDPSTIPMR